MKNILFVLAFLFVAPLLNAQDYYLTADKNAIPVVVSKITDMADILKAQGKDKKYQSVVLSFSNGEGIFILVPIGFNREISLDGISLTDKNDEEYYIDVSVKNSSKNPKEELEAFKKEATSSSAKVTSEKDITIGGKTIKEVLFSTPKGNFAAGYMLDYKKNLLFITQGTSKNIAERCAQVKKIIASLGVVQTVEYASSVAQNLPPANTLPAAAPSAANTGNNAASASSAEAQNPAVTAMKQAGLGTAQDVEDTDIHSLKVTAQGTKTNKVAFKYAGGSYYVLSSSDIKATLEDGRIYFTTPKRGKNIMYLEVPGQKSKTFYASAIKEYGEGHALKAQPAKELKLGANSVRLIRKTALNKSANNYFIKKDGNFVLSYIADSKDDIYFDGVAKAVLTSFTQE